MKKFVCAALFLASFGASADVVFEKDNGILDMTSKGSGSVDFSINSNVDGSSCEIEGNAIIVDDRRAVFTPEDKKDMCVVVFNFQSAIDVNVTAKDCNGYCGLLASGSLNGIYRKTSN